MFWGGVYNLFFVLKKAKHEELKDRIVGIFYRVYNIMGYGFLEKVYENALAIEFEEEGLESGK